MKLRGTNAAREFCTLLIPQDQLGVSSAVVAPSEEEVPLPSLTELHIELANMNYYVVGQPSLGEQLTAALRVRKTSNAHIQLLSIERSEVALEWIPV